MQTRNIAASLLITTLGACTSSGDAPKTAPDASSSPGPQQDADVDAGDAAAEAGDPSSEGDLPIDPEYASLAQTIESERASLGAPGVAVVILRHGNVVFAHGFGTKGPASKDAVTSHTLFRIASMTKALTATAALHLVDEGKMSLDAPITDILPKLAVDGVAGSGLTMEKLLTQQSGLVDYLEVDAPGADPHTALATYLESDTFRQNEYLMVAPGTFYDYANPNYYILGRALEKAGGVAYAEAMKSTVFSPLGMTRTFFRPADVLTDGDYTNALGTDPKTKAPGDLAPDAYDNPWGWPCGYAFTSARQYARFVQFLMNGNEAVLKNATLDAMRTGHVSTHDLGDVVKYGYGIESTTGFFLGTSYYAEPLITHNGELPGYATQFAFVPRTGFGFVVLANRENVTFGKSIVAAMTAFAELPSPSPSPVAAPTQADLDAIAGTYVDPHQYVVKPTFSVGPITLAHVGPDLTITMPDLDAAKIAYDRKPQMITREAFVETVNGAPFEFQVSFDGAGKARYVYTRYFVASPQPPSDDAGTPHRPPQTPWERTRSHSAPLFFTPPPAASVERTPVP